MNEDMKNTFIPCGDSMEKMNGEMPDNELDVVSGGVDVAPDVYSDAKFCPHCHGFMMPTLNRENMAVFNYCCSKCGYTEKA